MENAVVIILQAVAREAIMACHTAQR